MRERDGVSGDGAERERARGTEDPDSRLCADSREPNVGLELMNHEIMT